MHTMHTMHTMLPWLPHRAVLFVKNVILACIAALFGCGSVNETPGGAVQEDAANADASWDAAVDASGNVDASYDAGLGAWSTPSRVTALSSESGEFKPSVTSDLLEMYFISSRNGGTDVWMSSRSSVDDPWGAPVEVTEVNTGAAERDPAVSADGLTLWFVSNRTGTVGGLDIWVSVRASRNDSWGAPVNVGELNTAADDRGPMVTSGGEHMVLYSNRSGSMGCPDNCSFDLYRTSRSSPGGTWEQVVPISALNTDATEAGPWQSDDRLTLYFFSDRAVAGNLDIYESSRADTNSFFGDIKAVMELNTASADSDPWLSRDQRYLLMSSNRDGDAEIYQSTR